MTIDIEEMKRGLGSFRLILEHSEQLRSWLYTGGKTEDERHNSYSDDIVAFDEIVEKISSHNWNLKEHFIHVVTDGCGEHDDLPFVPGYEKKVDEHINQLEL